MPGSRVKVSGFVLAGGKSARMGRDKAFLDLGGGSLIRRVIDVITSVTDDVAVIGDPVRFAGLNVPVFADVISGFGPLAGIHSALMHANHNHALIVGCDLPFVRESLLELLVSKLPCDGAVVPRNSHGQTEQLCSIYSRRLLPVVGQLISEGIHTPRALYERAGTVFVEWKQIAELAGSGDFFFNVNTEEEYQRAKEILASRRK